jgi:hypothetical protein
MIIQYGDMCTAQHKKINMAKIFKNSQKKVSLMKVNYDAQKQPLQARVTRLLERKTEYFRFFSAKKKRDIMGHWKPEKAIGSVYN